MTNITSHINRSSSVEPLDTTDRSPLVLAWTDANFLEQKIKAPIRRPIYAALRFVSTFVLSKLHQSKAGFAVDSWLWGQRGNDYAAHRRLVSRYMPLEGKKIFVAGCGTGKDIYSWLRYNPASILGLDYFNYNNAWRNVSAHFSDGFPLTQVQFAQGDLTNITDIEDGTFDLVSSDAVLEHIVDSETAYKELYRILKPGGILYSTFGPLWFGWHGDHFSGWDHINNGFNHIALAEEQYQRYLEERPYSQHSEEDGRTWIKHGMFSYLKPAQYLALLEQAGFHTLHTGLLIEPKAVKCLAAQPELKNRLLQNHGIIDLLAYGMTVVVRKPN